MPSLIVTSGPLSGQVFGFSDTAVIGRGQFSDVRLNDPTVSRRHALIQRNGVDYELRDEESANGTYCRRRRVSGTANLRDGDEVQFGEIKAVFRSASSDQPALPPPAQPDMQSTRARAVAAARSDAALPAADATGLREMLARMKLFCNIGALARGSQDLRAMLDEAMQALLIAFPQITRAAVYASRSGSDTMNLLAQRVASTAKDAAFGAVEAFLGEARRLEFGLQIKDAASRDALAARLRVDAVPAAVLGMPLRLGREALGVLYLESTLTDAAWRTADRDVLVGIAGQLAWLIGCNQAQTPERAIELHDLALARRIQQRFLPQSPPNLPGYRIADSYAAARVIGGDYFDFFQYRDGQHGLVIADVSGKAVSGALYMARLSVQVRTLARHLSGPEELLTGLNRKLAHELEPGMFVTMLAAAIEPKTGLLEFANAGHPAPLLRTRDGKVVELGESGALPLGAVSDTSFRQFTATIAPGECVLFYTDGLDEAHDAAKQLFGKERVVKALADGGANAQAALDTVLAEVARFTAGEEQSDDLTLITLARETR